MIVEICEGIYIFYFKERVRKYIYFDLEGEMYWSIDVFYVFEFIYSNVYFLLKISYLWLLFGGLCGFSFFCFLIYKD